MLSCPKCNKPPLFVVKDGVATVDCCVFVNGFSFKYQDNRNELESHWDNYVRELINNNRRCSVCGRIHVSVENKLMCEEAHKHTPPYKRGDFIKVKFWHDGCYGNDWFEIKDVEINDVELCFDDGNPVWQYVFTSDDPNIDAFHKIKYVDCYDENNHDILELVATAEQMEPHYQRAEKLKEDLKATYGVNSGYEINSDGSAYFSFVLLNNDENKKDAQFVVAVETLKNKGEEDAQLDD